MRGLGGVGERLNEAMSRGGIPALLAGKEGGGEKMEKVFRIDFLPDPPPAISATAPTPPRCSSPES